jgi:putative transport protein
MENLIALFENEYVAFFAIVAIGILLGKIEIKGISLDTSAIIFVALLFGHYGVKMPDILQKFGLIFFIYSVGIQAGPGFFESFKKDGLKLIFITALAVGSGAIVTVILSKVLNIETELAVGIFAGAMTSTPGLAAAIESTGSTLASIGYGIAYPFGVLAVILFVKVSPKIFKVSIPTSELEYEKAVKSDFPGLINKNFVVENLNIFGKSLGELKIRTMTHSNISRILHEGQAFTPTESSVLHKDDVVKAVGTAADLLKVQLLIGNETNTPIPLSDKYVVQTILVTNESAINKPLEKLGLMEQYNATITSMRRAGIDITPNASTKLHFGDKVKVACAEESLIPVKKMLGDNHKRLTELDFLPVSIGIILGILIGHIQIPIFGFSFSLGLTGGVLVSAIILSRIGKTGPILWNVSGSSNQLLRNLGLIFFLVAVGTNAGGSLVATIQSGGFKLLLVGVAITTIPMLVAMIVGHFFMKINFLVLLGALTGSMTSTPALSAVEPMTESNGPKIAYATVYPFALVLIIICCQLMALLMIK